MEKDSAQVAGAITVAWLNLHARETVAIPDQSVVVEFYRTIYETIYDCSVSRRSKSRIRPKPEGF